MTIDDAIIELAHNRYVHNSAGFRHPELNEAITMAIDALKEKQIHQKYYILKELRRCQSCKYANKVRFDGFDFDHYLCKVEQHCPVCVEEISVPQYLVEIVNGKTTYTPIITTLGGDYEDSVGVDGAVYYDKKEAESKAKITNDNIQNRFVNRL